MAELKSSRRAKTACSGRTFYRLIPALHLTAKGIEGRVLVAEISAFFLNDELPSCVKCWIKNWPGLKSWNGR